MNNLTSQMKKILFGTGAVLGVFLIRKWANGARTHKTKRMDGKVIVVTGPSGGIGKETAMTLLSQGATVIFAARDIKKTNAILEEIKDENLRKRAHIIQCDLADFKSIKEFSNQFKQNFNKLDILVNNAGAWNNKFELTKDGIENTIGSNHLGPMVLTSYLLDTIQNSSGRIINVASQAHLRAKVDFDKIKNLVLNGIPKDYDFNKSSYSMLPVYSESKLANIYFSKYLAEHFSKNNINVRVASLHPGVIYTGFFWSANPLLNLLAYPIARLIMKTVYYGAQTTLELCYLDDKEFVNGAYYDECKVKETSETANDKDKRDLYMQYSKLLIDTYGKPHDIQLKF